jgi:hypothetical protein
MSESSQPLTFGVEFEITLAFVLETENPPNPSENRTVTFDTIESDYWHPYQIGHNPMGRFGIQIASRNAAFRHIKSTLKNAGYSVERDGDTTEWSLTSDSSIYPPVDSPKGYEYLELELVSPAYYFVPESLKAIEEVLALLKSTYLMDVNFTTGMHVHCGDSLQGFKFDTLKKIVSFLFAFTPQLNTTHPSNRQDVTVDTYAGSLRENSRFEIRRRPTDKARPTPIQASSTFLNSKMAFELLRHAGNPTSPKMMAYNLAAMKMMAEGVRGFAFKPTIEFRQHEGCIDATEAINWIKTVVGIVDFCVNAPTAAVYGLLEVAKLETWEKLGDGHDVEREAEFGPILADRDFTAIHLLQALKLWGPALHYAQKGLFKHEMEESTKEETKKLDYEKKPLKDSAVLAQQIKLRKAWDALQAASKARELVDPPARTRWTFNPADPLWPSHDAKLDKGVDTDVTTDEGSLGDYSFSDSQVGDDSQGSNSQGSDGGDGKGGGDNQDGGDNQKSSSSEFPFNREEQDGTLPTPPVKTPEQTYEPRDLFLPVFMSSSSSSAHTESLSDSDPDAAPLPRLQIATPSTAN